jgi:uncharacterized protein YceH (UPF0502 family)
VDLDAVEVRVLGCLIEKQRTTPDIYPLTLNALRAACNQSTNRDPVVAYDEATIREALQRLGRRGLTRLAGASRAAKFRHLLDDTLRLPAAEQAVLAVLALRGPQTPGELRQRTERLHRFPDAAALQAALDGLAQRGLAVRVARMPGQKEERYMHLLSADADEPVAAASYAPVPAAPRSAEDDRLARLERQVAELTAEVRDLRAQLGG